MQLRYVGVLIVYEELHVTISGPITVERCRLHLSQLLKFGTVLFLFAICRYVCKKPRFPLITN